jgi:uncharacterized protein YfdQ (DUF2303 family)
MTGETRLTDAEAIIETAQEAVDPKVIDRGDLISVVVAEGNQHVLVDTERFLDAPTRKRGVAELHTADSLSAYVEKHNGEGTLGAELYADLDTFSIVAVFNGHTADGAGWGDHRGVLTLRKTPEWKRWTEADNRLMSQVQFAELIEDGLGEIVEPPAAEVLEMAQHFEAAVKVNFKSSRLLDNGQRQITYEETIDAKAGQLGQIVIPRELVLGIAPFEGCVGYRVVARLRYRLNDGQLGIGIVLDHPEKVLESAFDDEVNKVEEPTGIRAYRGKPLASNGGQS